MALTIGTGITIGGGITVAPTRTIVTNGLLLNFDAATYTGQTTGPQQNVSGTSDNVGFFPYGWNSAPPTGFGNIAPGWICIENNAVVTVANSVNHTITTTGTPFISGGTYTFIGPWIDSAYGVQAVPSNAPVWSSSNGGTFVLSAPSTQYFTVPWPIFQPTYTLDIWFNFTDNQIGGAPCLISDDYVGAPFNFTINVANNYLQTGWYTTNWGGQYATNNVQTALTHDGSTWYNIIMSVGATQYKDYINGVATYAPGNFGGGSAPNGSSPTHQFYIGHRWDGTDTVNAKMAVVNVYDRALTDAEALQNFNYYRSRFGL